MSLVKFIVIFLLIVVLGVLQNTNLLMFAGIKPNLLLAIIIGLAFFIEDAWLYGFFAILSAVFLSVGGFFTPEILVFILLAVIAFWAAARWHTQPFLNYLILIGALTFIFYLLTSPFYIISNPVGLFIELAYNAVLGALLYKTLELCLETNSMLKT